MYELLLRTETLLLGLQMSALWAVGIGASVVGLVLWLGGTRYHAAIIGVLGAVVGSAAGLLVGERLGVNPWLSAIVGAAVLGGLSILLRNVLILVLAVLVFSAVGGTGYVAVRLDRAGPPVQPQVGTPEQTQPPSSSQYFTGMEPADRLTYLNDISQQAQTFTQRLKALLANTWEALGPRGWLVVLPLLVGALVGILLVWLVAKVVIALAYSIVGAALILLGAQATLLAAGVPIVSDLASRRWLPAVTFAAMTVAGWVWQLFFAGAKPRREESDRQTDTPD